METKMKSPLKPNAKFDNLVVQEFSDEILIYNLENNKAYSLNQTSKLVWENCDGTKDAGQIANAIAKNLKQEVPDDLVWIALDNLKNEGLINFEGDSKSVFAGFSRRDAIKRVGLATMVALPLMVSITAPSPAHAQSGVASCTSCVVNLGLEDTGVCPEACAGLKCTCYGNNSCMGVGQLTLDVTCEACKGIGGAKNNSWRCEG
jgi:hypothetical protein